MQDLSSLTKALSEAVKKPDEGLVTTINDHLLSEDVATRRAVVETLVELLDGSSEDYKARQEVILKETALMFIPSLLPILNDAPVPVKHLFALIGSTARPKEVVLALNEALQAVEERIEDLTFTDISDDEQEELSHEGVKHQDLVQETLALVVKTYAQVLPRMSSPKSTPTVLTMSEAVSSALAGLAPITPTPPARDILQNTCELVENSWRWAERSSDKGGEQKTILFNLLCMTISRYSAGVNAQMFEKWFLDEHPKYAGLHDEVLDLGGITVLEQARRTLEVLGYGLPELQSFLGGRNGSPFATLASITVLARYEMTNPAASTSISLSDQMTALTAALSGSAIDAGLLKTFAFLRRGGIPDQDQATLLIELVMPLAALPTLPTTQTALLKLIEAIVNSQTPQGKVLILKQLLEPENPFESIRIRSIGILRSQLSSDRHLLPQIMPQLYPILFTIPTDPPVVEMGLADLKGSMYPAWFAECANLLWFILDLDHDGQAGLRTKDSVGIVNQQWLMVVVGYYEKIKAEAEGSASGQEDGEGTFILQIWGDALIRAQKSVNDVLGRA